MKKYIAIIAGVILLTTMIQMVEDELEEIQWEGYDWVESCYGIECTDIEPRGDWGYATDYCKKLKTSYMDKTYVKMLRCNI